MRQKPIPQPRSLEGLWTVRDALPLVPGSVEDCCHRLVARADVTDRDAARSWLAFLYALGLADRQDGSYYRGTDRPDVETVATNFRENVFGAREVLAAVGEGPTTTDAAFEATRELVPRWERERDPEWEQSWRVRTEHLLQWAVVFDLIVGTDEGYRRLD